MAKPLRLLDTGVHAGRYNIALDQALIDGHRAGATPDTLRFLGFSPSALIGRHQDLSREIDLEFCRERGIDVGRRVTGGGAIYLDEHQIGWELICARRHLKARDLAGIAALVCKAAAGALNGLGIAAKFRPRNDIEVDGRKIGGTGGFFDGDTLFFQGTLILALDAETMFRVLRVPEEKRARAGDGGVASRVTSLAEILAGEPPPAAQAKDALARGMAKALGFTLAPGELTSSESAAADALLREEIGTDDFVHAIDGGTAGSAWSHAQRSTAGGTLHAAVKFLPNAERRIESVHLSGDFFLTPPRVVYDLESTLRQVPAGAAGGTVKRFFKNTEIEMMSVPVDDIVAVIEDAVA